MIINETFHYYLHLLSHGRRVNFEMGCRINGQKSTNVEHSFQNRSIQKTSISVIIYQINRYIYMYIYIQIYIYNIYNIYIYIYIYIYEESKSICILSLYE